MKKIILTLFILLSSTLSFATEKYHYVFPRPYEVEAKLGKIAKYVHVVGETVWQFPKVYFFYTLSGEPISTFLFAVYEFGKTPGMVLAQSFADLNLRYQFKQRKLLNQLSKIKGITDIRMVTTKKLKYEGFIASEQNNKGLIFIETDHPLNTEELSKLSIENMGGPIEITDLEKSKIKLNVAINGQQYGMDYFPSLKDIFSKPEIPENVLASWQEEIDKAVEEKKLYKKQNEGKMKAFLTGLVERHEELEIVASLEIPNQTPRRLGAIASGNNAINIVKETFIEKLIKKIKRSKKASSKKVPLTSTKIIRGNDSGEGNCASKLIKFIRMETIRVR